MLKIIDDAMNLAKSSYLDYPTALATTAYLARENEFLPWASALNGEPIINEGKI